MIEAPPFDAGAAHETVTPAPAALAATLRGAEGTVAGVADSAFDSGPFPTELVAWTVNEIGDLERLVRLGVDGLCGNYPDRIRVTLAARNDEVSRI